MKKGLILFLITVLLVGMLTACGGSGTESNQVEPVDNVAPSPRPERPTPEIEEDEAISDTPQQETPTYENHELVGMWASRFTWRTYNVFEFFPDGTLVQNEYLRVTDSQYEHMETITGRWRIDTFGQMVLYDYFDTVDELTFTYTIDERTYVGNRTVTALTLTFIDEEGTPHHTELTRVRSEYELPHNGGIHELSGQWEHTVDGEFQIIFEFGGVFGRSTDGTYDVRNWNEAREEFELSPIRTSFQWDAYRNGWIILYDFHQFLPLGITFEEDQPEFLEGTFVITGNILTLTFDGEILELQRVD